MNGLRSGIGSSLIATMILILSLILGACCEFWGILNTLSVVASFVIVCCFIPAVRNKCRSFYHRYNIKTLLITMIATIGAIYLYMTYGKDIPYVQYHLERISKVVVWTLIAYGVRGIYRALKRDKIAKLNPPNQI